MTLYDTIRHLVSKRRKAPVKSKNAPRFATIADVCQGGTIAQNHTGSQEPAKPVKGLLVSVDEYNLLKLIKDSLKMGKTVIFSPPNPEKLAYNAAREVKKGKGLNDIETIIETGFYVEEE